jgi:His-Xaa-Ser system protein HxsD
MESRSSTTIEFDLSLFRLSAIKKAAYKIGDRCHIQIERTAPDRVSVTLRSKRPLEMSTESCVGELRNEVLDQDLREIVAEETAAIRNVLLAQVFSKTSLLDPAEAADWREDPLKIGIVE